MAPKKPLKRVLPQSSKQSQQLPQLRQPSTSTSNQFQELEDNDDMDSVHSYASTVSKKSKRSERAMHPRSLKPPPLTVVGVKYSDVGKQMSSIKNFDNDFEFQLTSQGIRVYTLTNEIFNKAKDLLISHNINFFTHSLREEQTNKFVLRGLVDRKDYDWLFSSLKNLNVEPIKIRKLTIKNPKYQHQANYLLYFLKSQKVKISELREIKAIGHVMVKWEFYSNRRNGPIQCSNCMAFGHDGNSCFLKSRCIRCAEQHKSIDCPMLIGQDGQTRNKVPDNQLKCVHCGQNHTANYSKCEVRLNLIERKEKLKKKAHIRNTQARPNFNWQHNTNDFPPLQSNPTRTIPGFKPSTLQYAQVTQSNNLFNSDQLMEIFTEMMTKMRAASDKLMQIQILGEMVIKYCSSQTQQ